MSKPFDATTKRLVELQPEAWARLLLALPPGTPLPPVRVVNSDVSTVTAAVDHVLLVEADEPFLLHFEFESRYHAENPKRIRFYNVQLNYGHDVRVRSCVTLLRRSADGPALTGRLTEGSVEDGDLLDFQYRVLRVHAMDPAQFLAGDLATLPLAPIAAVSGQELPRVVAQVEERLTREAEAPLADDLWAATYVLLGLNHRPAFVQQLMKGIRKMQDSSTYQEILSEGRAEGLRAGRAEEARSVLLRLGQKRLGTPDAAVVARVAAVGEIAELERLIDRLLEVETWQELLG